MAEGMHRHPGPEYEGGSQPAPDLPPDEPGKGRGPLFFFIAVIAVLVMAVPIAWGLWALVTVGYAIGATALVFLWIIWGCCALAFLWVVRALWRRAA